MYTMLFSKYRERVAVATTARDFANMWLVIFASLFVGTALNLCVEFFDSLQFEDSEVLDLWIDIVDFTICWLLGLWYFLYIFREPDVRFWDPRLYLQKKRADGLDIEKIRKMHTDDSVAETVRILIFMLLFMLAVNALFILGYLAIVISYFS